MSKYATPIILTLVFAVGMVAFAVFGPIPQEIVEGRLSDQLTTQPQEVVETVVEDPFTATPAETESPTLDPFTNTLTETPTPTLTETPIPPTATEAPREIGCGPACENLNAVFNAASLNPATPNRVLYTYDVDDNPWPYCVGYLEYKNPDGSWSGEFAECLDLAPDGMVLCEYNVHANQDACGSYTLAIFRIGSMQITDIPYHASGWAFPQGLLTNSYYHLGTGYFPLVLPGDFTGATSLGALKEAFLSAYAWQIEKDPGNGSIPLMAEHLIAAYPMGIVSGETVRNSTSELSDESTNRDNRIVKEEMKLFYSDFWTELLP